jgi:hypothetical protein
MEKTKDSLPSLGKFLNLKIVEFKARSLNGAPLR